MSFAVDSILNFNYPSTPGNSKITGCVTGNGEPALDVAVSASNMGNIIAAPNTSFVASTTTGPGGCYELDVLSGTNYALSFTPLTPEPTAP